MVIVSGLSEKFGGGGLFLYICGLKACHLHYQIILNKIGMNMNTNEAIYVSPLMEILEIVSEQAVLTFSGEGTEDDEIM